MKIFLKVAAVGLKWLLMLWFSALNNYYTSKTTPFYKNEHIIFNCLGLLTFCGSFGTVGRQKRVHGPRWIAAGLLDFVKVIICKQCLPFAKLK